MAGLLWRVSVRLVSEVGGRAAGLTLGAAVGSTATLGSIEYDSSSGLASSLSSLSRSLVGVKAFEKRLHSDSSPRLNMCPSLCWTRTPRQYSPRSGSQQRRKVTESGSESHASLWRDDLDPGRAWIQPQRSVIGV